MIDLAPEFLFRKLALGLNHRKHSSTVLSITIIANAIKYTRQIIFESSDQFIGDGEILFCNNRLRSLGGSNDHRQLVYVSLLSSDVAAESITREVRVLCLPVFCIPPFSPRFRVTR